METKQPIGLVHYFIESHSITSLLGQSTIKTEAELINQLLQKHRENLRDAIREIINKEDDGRDFLGTLCHNFEVYMHMLPTNIPVLLEAFDVAQSTPYYRVSSSYDEKIPYGWYKNGKEKEMLCIYNKFATIRDLCETMAKYISYLKYAKKEDNDISLAYDKIAEALPKAIEANINAPEEYWPFWDIYHLASLFKQITCHDDGHPKKRFVFSNHKALHKSIADNLPAMFALLSKHIDIASKDHIEHIKDIVNNEVLFEAFKYKREDSKVVESFNGLLSSLSKTNAGRQDMFYYTTIGNLGKMKEILDNV